MGPGRSEALPVEHLHFYKTLVRPIDAPPIAREVDTSHTIITRISPYNYTQVVDAIDEQGISH